jgi:chitinase
MTYDFSGPWTQASGHHAQLTTPTYPHSDEAFTSCDSAISYMLAQGVPSRKILLGIPVYGRSFLGATKTGDRFTGHGGEEGTFEYRDLPRPGALEGVDEQAGAAFCVGGDGGFVTYDNPRTVQLKAHFAKQRRLGGLFYWTGTADARGPRSLVEMGYNTLHDL